MLCDGDVNLLPCLALRYIELLPDCDVLIKTVNPTISQMGFTIIDLYARIIKGTNSR